MQTQFVFTSPTEYVGAVKMFYDILTRELFVEGTKSFVDGRYLQYGGPTKGLFIELKEHEIAAMKLLDDLTGLKPVGRRVDPDELKEYLANIDRFIRY